MKLVRRLVAATLLAGALYGPAHAAGSGDPLFVSLTSDDKHRIEMSINIGKAQMDLGHPFTLFLSDRSVQVASSMYSPKFATQQKLLKQAIDAGATVLVCSGCMQHFGIDKANLLPGIQPTDPVVIEAALFKDHTRTLSW